MEVLQCSQGMDSVTELEIDVIKPASQGDDEEAERRSGGKGSL